MKKVSFKREDIDTVVEALKKGSSLNGACELVGWSPSTLSRKRNKNKRLDGEIRRALLSFESEVNEAWYDLIKERNDKVVIKEKDYRFRREERYSYRQSLVDAQKKAIADLDFEKARAIGVEIEQL